MKPRVITPRCKQLRLERAYQKRAAESERRLEEAQLRYMQLMGQLAAETEQQKAAH